MPYLTLNINVMIGSYDRIFGKKVNEISQGLWLHLLYYCASPSYVGCWQGPYIALIIAFMGNRNDIVRPLPVNMQDRDASLPPIPLHPCSLSILILHIHAGCSHSIACNAKYICKQSTISHSNVFHRQTETDNAHHHHCHHRTIQDIFKFEN